MSAYWYRRGVPKGLPVGIKGVFQKVYLLISKGCSESSTCWYRSVVPKGLPVGIEGVLQKVYLLVPKGWVFETSKRSTCW